MIFDQLGPKELYIKIKESKHNLLEKYGYSFCQRSKFSYVDNTYIIAAQTPTMSKIFSC